MSELPSGWGRAEIGDLCNLINGRAFKPQEWSEFGLPIIRIQNLNNPDAKFNHFSGTFDAKHHVKNGDLLFAWSGTPGTSFGAHIWHGADAVLNQHIFKIEFSELDINRGFLLYAINQKLDELIGSAQGGVGLRHVTKGTFEKTEIVFPPLAEQIRIAAKLDELLAKVDTLKARIDAVPALLKRFRQSVLASAVSGRLTEEWRAARMKSGEVGAQDAINFKKLSDICLSITDGDHQAPPQSDTGIPFITISAINDGVIRLEKATRYVPYSYYSELKESRKPQIGDILFSVTGSICIPAMVLNEAPFTFQRHIAILRPNTALALQKFMYFYLSSEQIKKQGLDVATGTAQLTVSLKGLRNFDISLPSFEEQTEIVRRIEQLFAFADQLEAKVAAAKSRIDHLTQSILTKAFRGELVPQYPNDEPASVLLERIKAQRAAAPKAKRGRKASV